MFTYVSPGMTECGRTFRILDFSLAKFNKLFAMFNKLFASCMIRFLIGYIIYNTAT